MQLAYLHGFASGPSSSKGTAFQRRFPHAELLNLRQPSFEHLRLSAMIAHVQANRAKEAITWFDRALARTPNRSRALFGLARAYRNAGDAANGVANPGLWGGDGSFAGQAYPVPSSGPNPDGHVFLFQSKAPLTSEDADGGRRDNYRYNALSGTLQCVTCRSGGADAEPFAVAVRGSLGVPLGTDFAEQARWASEDGETVVFKTAEPLVSGDINGATDSYLWRAGSFYRLPGTADPNSKLADNPILSHEGSEVAFQSTAQLLPTDVDSATDVYVSRAGGGFANPSVPPAPCEGEACQGPPIALPVAPKVGSSTPSGSGNVKPKASPHRCPKGKRTARRKGAMRCVARKHHQSHQSRRAAK